MLRTIENGPNLYELHLPEKLYSFLNKNGLLPQAQQKSIEKEYSKSITITVEVMLKDKAPSKAASVHIKIHHTFEKYYLHDHFIFQNRMWCQSTYQDPKKQQAGFVTYKRANEKFSFFSDRSYSDNKSKKRTPQEEELLIERLSHFTGLAVPTQSNKSCMLI